MREHKYKAMKTVEDYLAEPYRRVLIPDRETQTYTAMISEFPGCIAQGDTVDEAYTNLEDAAKSWIEASLELGNEIPDTALNQKFSGKILLRVPKILHERASRSAESEGVSLNQFIVSVLSRYVGIKGSDLTSELEVDHG